MSLLRPGSWSRLQKSVVAATVAVSFVGAHEGLRTKAYLDVAAIPTICYGSTKGVSLGQEKTRKECDELLIHDLTTHEKGMRNCLRDPDALPDKTYVAFLSFTFNVGVGAFCKSTLARRVNAGDVRGACIQELPKWNRAAGREWAGLTRRRAEERDLCLEGLAEHARVPS